MQTADLTHHEHNLVTSSILYCEELNVGAPNLIGPKITEVFGVLRAKEGRGVVNICHSLLTSTTVGGEGPLRHCLRNLSNVLQPRSIITTLNLLFTVV